MSNSYHSFEESQMSVSGFTSKKVSRQVASLQAPELLTVREVADMLRVTPLTVRNWINAGRIKAIRTGYMFKIPTSEVQRMLAS